MPQKINLELPDDLSQLLEAKAQIINVSVETMILNSLKDLVAEPEDPIVALIGTLSYDSDDIASRHDEYIGEAIYSQELTREK